MRIRAAVEIDLDSVANPRHGRRIVRHDGHLELEGRRRRIAPQGDGDPACDQRKCMSSRGRCDEIESPELIVRAPPIPIRQLFVHPLVLIPRHGWLRSWRGELLGLAIALRRELDRRNSSKDGSIIHLLGFGSYGIRVARRGCCASCGRTDCSPRTAGRQGAAKTHDGSHRPRRPT